MRQDTLANLIEGSVDRPEEAAEAAAEAEAPAGATPAEEGGAAEQPQEPKLLDVGLDELLQDPELGPLVESYAQSKAEQEARQKAQQAQQEALLAQWQAYFQALDDAELAEALQDPQRRQAYLAVHQWQQQQAQVQAEQLVQQRAKVQAYAEQIRTLDRMLQRLPEEKRKELDPRRYTYLGEAGIGIWTQAVLDAVSDHMAEQRIQAELEKRWEALRQERLAELERETPVPSGLQPSGPLPDLMTTDPQTLLELALQGRPLDRKRT